jgi:hypothetical protein
MAVWRRPGLLWQGSSGVSSGAMVFLKVSARTGRADCMRSRGRFPPSSGSTATSIFFLGRWQGARGMIEWLCTQERLNPEVAIILGTAARYNRVKVRSNHNDANPGNSALHTRGGSSSLRPLSRVASSYCPCGPWPASARKLSCSV